MRNRYLLIGLLVIGVCLAMGVCRFNVSYGGSQYIEGMNGFSSDTWTGAYVYTIPNNAGGTLSIKMTDPASRPENLGTITLHSFQTQDGKTVPEQVWIVKAEPTKTVLVGGNFCSHIMITKTDDIDSGTALEIINVKLANLNNEVIDLDKFLLRGGCCGDKMDVWVANAANELYKGNGDGQWCKIQDGYNFVKVTNDYIFGLKPGANNILKCKRPCNSSSTWEPISGTLSNMGIADSGWFGTNADGNTYYSEGPIESPTFRGPNGERVNVAVLNDNYFYVIMKDSGSILYRSRREPAGLGRWVEMKNANATTLAVDNSSYWLVAASGPHVGKILSGTINQSNGAFDPPQHVEGALTYVSMDNQYVYGVNGAHEIFKCTRPDRNKPGCIDKWQKIHGSATQISSYF